ncbi:MAG: hypothetical protein F4029_17185 [Gammaproteobacteria bacterium]|nr:hypothetical protein [Gammaproteobacteria bacterium]MYK47953.1 hypothetical protein [Gammaproteobacteria bacterium]
MATPRHLLVDPENECDYHLASRCVRRAFLCGVDEYTGRNCSHRRTWLVDRLKQLSPCFAVDVYAYTVLSNHFHLVLRHDPLAHRWWSDEEVAWRWFEAFPPTEQGAVVEALKPERRELMLDNPKRLARARCTLGSMSNFMKHLKQPIARRANLEDDCTGHFFEQRFYSGALLTEEALIAAMAYVDLNPVRAELAEHIEEIRETSICDRLLENSTRALEDYLRPVLSGLDHPLASASPGVVAVVGSPIGGSMEALGPQEATSRSQPDGAGEEPDPERRCDAGAETADPEPAETVPEPKPDVEDRREPPRRPRPHVTLAQYLELVRAMAQVENTPTTNTSDRVRRWLGRTKALRKRQRAYGSESVLRQWIADRNMQFRETPLPA